VKYFKAEGESILEKLSHTSFARCFGDEWLEHRDVKILTTSGSIQALQNFYLLMKSEIHNFIR